MDLASVISHMDKMLMRNRVDVGIGKKLIFSLPKYQLVTKVSTLNFSLRALMSPTTSRLRGLFSLLQRQKSGCAGQHCGDKWPPASVKDVDSEQFLESVQQTP
jgi:hypothetical protein